MSSNQSLQTALTKESKKLDQLRSKTKSLRASAVINLSYKYAFWVAIYFAVFTGLASIAQALLDDKFGLPEIDGVSTSVLQYLELYARDIVLLLAAFALGFWFHRLFLKRTQEASYRHALTIGFSGILAASIISILMINPDLVKEGVKSVVDQLDKVESTEQGDAQDESNVPGNTPDTAGGGDQEQAKPTSRVTAEVKYFGLPFLVFEFLCKIVVFPCAGFLGAMIAYMITRK